MVRQAIPDDIQVSFVGADLDNLADDGPWGRPVMRNMREVFDRKLARLSDPTCVLALGNESLYVTTGHSGIMKYRGREFERGRHLVIPSVAPQAVERNPRNKPLLEADIQAAVRWIKGEKLELTPAKVLVVNTKERLKQLISELHDCEVIAFDLETDSFDELRDGAFVVCMAITTRHKGPESDLCWVIPLCHKASPWRSEWKRVLQRVARAARKVPIRIAHNAKFDCRWLVQFDAPISSNFDTMLAAHLLDENRPKGLKALARILLGAPEWSINLASGKKAKPWYLQYPLWVTLKYCALDTWYTMKLYDIFSTDLQSDTRASALFNNLIMPCSQSLVHIERKGIYVDQKKLEEAKNVVEWELSEIHSALEEFVDEEDIPDGMKMNWNASTNFLKWFLFEHLGLQPVAYTDTGALSTAEGVMKHLAKEHEAAGYLAERVKWNKMNTSFVKPYKELVGKDSRLRTTFNLAGTVTGRTSSGKADKDKVTGATDIKGVNLQQVPRDPLIRGVFGAPEGSFLIEADYSQIELRIAAELARERTMLSIYSRGEDIHMAMAQRLTGKPVDEITKLERTQAKSVNFGFLYGMGPDKFTEQAFKNYGLDLTEEEARAFRKAFFQQFPDLLKWHARQRRLAHKYARVQSPFGRVRHLPDIHSRDLGVVAEAERQAINSPVQATGSDLCLLSLALLDRAFRKRELTASPIGTVHDSILFECPEEEVKTVVPLIKRTMENPPTRKLFGYELQVPLVADVAVVERWGG